MEDAELLAQAAIRAAEAAEVMLCDNRLRFGTVRLAQLTGAERDAMRDLLVRALIAGEIHQPPEKRHHLWANPGPTTERVEPR